MNREDYFNNALKIFDKRINFNWSSYPRMSLFPPETVSVSNYYETFVSKREGSEMYLVFAKYEYYASLSEENSLVSSDYVMIFYLKNVGNSSDITKLIQIGSKEYNTLLMDSDREFGDYLLPEVIRKITEMDKNVEDFFSEI